MEDFPEGKVDIWNWNVNGVNAILQKGILQEFIKGKRPTIICLQETKATLEKIDKLKYFDRIGEPGYA